MIIIPEHGCWLHFLVVKEFPTHCFPILDGRGELQYLSLVCIPFHRLRYNDSKTSRNSNHLPPSTETMVNSYGRRFEKLAISEKLTIVQINHITRTWPLVALSRNDRTPDTAFSVVGRTGWTTRSSSGLHFSYTGGRTATPITPYTSATVHYELTMIRL